MTSSSICRVRPVPIDILKNAPNAQSTHTYSTYTHWQIARTIKVRGKALRPESGPGPDPDPGNGTGTGTDSRSGKKRQPKNQLSKLCTPTTTGKAVM